VATGEFARVIPGRVSILATASTSIRAWQRRWSYFLVVALVALIIATSLNLLFTYLANWLSNIVPGSP